MPKWLQKEKAPKQEPSRERVSGGSEGGRGEKKSSFLVNLKYLKYSQKSTSKKKQTALT